MSGREIPEGVRIWGLATEWSPTVGVMEHLTLTSLSLEGGVRAAAQTFASLGLLALLLITSDSPDTLDAAEQGLAVLSSQNPLPLFPIWDTDELRP